MNDKDRAAFASSEEALSESGDESIDSLMRAVARVDTAERMSLRDLSPSSESRVSGAEARVMPPLPRVGDMLGSRYELTELLGAGGMGAVFAARHKGTGREVAIKVLLPHRGSLRTRQERIARFVREARAAGRIKHANVVDIYDVDGDSDTPYIVMERLHGESMWQCIKRGPLPAEEAVRVMIAAMHGVAEVHRQGVIHRDLKPDNIFLAHAADGGPAVPKVLDFGVSRIVVREGVEARPTTLTRAGYILGTPSYMPLEQLRGEPDVDARADVYALGVILYEALCGARPYEARNDHELVIRMATEAPTPLAHKMPNVDRSLAMIAIKALSRDPGQRFQDVESFAAALQRWRDGERCLEGPQEATPPEPAPHEPHIQVKLRPLRTGWALLALLLVLIMASWGVTRWLEPGSEALSPTHSKPAPITLPALRTAPPAAAPEPIAPVPAPLAEPAIAPFATKDAPNSSTTRRARPIRRAPARAPEEPRRDPETTLNPEDF